MATTMNSGAGVAPRRSPPGSGGRWRRYLPLALAMLAVVGALVLVKGAQIFTIIKAGKRMQAAGPPPETVSTFVAAVQTWNETIDAVGSIATGRGVNISNDAPGIVSRIAFESGASVRAGQVLVELDSRVEQAQLASVHARKRLAQVNAERSRALFASGSIAPAQKDTDESELAAAAADETAILAQIDRKIIRAPFAGKLGIRLVNVGQYLAPGTPVTVLESNESNYVDFTLPQQDIGRVAVGMPVELVAESGDAGAGARGQGKIYAVEPAVDPTTRSIKLRATVPQEGTSFRPGMFVHVAVLLPKTATVVAVPATAIVHAPYGDSAFAVEREKNGEKGSQAVTVVRQTFVKLGQARGDFVAVTNGLSPGEEVVTAGAFKLRNRARIVVNNEIDVHPELSPHPPNR